MSEKIEKYQWAPRSEIRLVPGDIVYDMLIQKDPKRLQRMIRQEIERYQKTHAPGWAEEFNAMADRGLATLERLNKKKPDYQMLGLDQVNEKITKRVVTNAYRRKARKLHPDVGGDAEAFKALHAAYRRVLAAAPKE